MTTASIVARHGWIIPAPFAIPPTVKPSRSTTAVFGPASVVRIASAAVGPPPGESAAAAASTPASSFSMGSRGPMTPVESTTTCSGASPSAAAAWAAVASASSSPASPVAALATPALTTTACGSASDRCRRETTTGAACTRFVVHIAQPTVGTSRADECDVRLPGGADPGADARRGETLGGRDGHQTSTPASLSPVVSAQAEEEVDVLDGLAGGALAEVVEGADDDRAIGVLVLEHPDLRPVGVLNARKLRGDALGKNGDERARRVVRLEQCPEVGAGRAHVARGDQAPANRQQVRRERDREAEQLRDLRYVLMGADPVRRDVLEHEAGVRRRLRRAAGACHPGHRVDDDGAPVDRGGQAARARAAPPSRSNPGSRRGGPQAARAREAHRPSRRARPVWDA